MDSNRPPLTASRFTKKHDWILRKLERYFGPADDRRTLAQFVPDELRGIRGWGPAAIQRLREMQEDISFVVDDTSPVEGPSLDEGREEAWDAAHHLQPAALNLARLSDRERSAIQKLERKMDRSITSCELARFDLARLTSYSALGQITVSHLEGIRSRVLDELITVATIGVREVPPPGVSRWIVRDEVDPSVLDTVLAEDVDHFVSTLNDSVRACVLNRIGFGVARSTLRQLAAESGRSRETIRKFTEKAVSLLPRACRFDSATIAATIRCLGDVSLARALPTFAGRFSIEACFLDALERCADLGPGTLASKQLLPASFSATRWLRDLLMETPPPLHWVDLEATLVEDHDLSARLAGEVLAGLVDAGLLRREGTLAFASNMSDRLAVVHVLAGEPDGLPWRDTIEIANRLRLSRRRIPAEKRTGAFQHPLLYTCGLGAYRHTRFLDLPEETVRTALRCVRTVLEASGERSAKLDRFAEACAQAVGVDYFTLRQIVAEHGAEQGLYFMGKSRVDTVKLDPTDRDVTELHRAERLLRESPRALTLADVAERLRSKSLGHASYLVHALMDSGEALRVNRKLYWTPDRAFADMDTERVLEALTMIVKREARPIEADLLRCALNARFGLDYSKFLYVGLVRHFGAGWGLHVAGSLISSAPLPYQTLLDAAARVCDRDATTAENLAALQTYLRISDRVAATSVRNWLEAGAA